MTAIGSITGGIAIMFGLYCLAAGLGMAASPDRIRRMLQEAEESAALSFAIGLLVLCIGAAITLTHPMGESWLSILVTIIGWGALLEGAIFLAAPQLMWAIARPFMNWNARIWGVVAILIGGGLIVAGWCHL